MFLEVLVANQTVPFNPHWAIEMRRRREECDTAFRSTRRAIQALETMRDILARRSFYGLRDARDEVAERLAEIDYYLSYWVPTEDELADIRAQNEADGFPEAPDES